MADVLAALAPFESPIVMTIAAAFVLAAADFIADQVWRAAGR